MGFMGYIFKALGFESDENKIKIKKNKSKASYNLKNAKANKRVEQIDGIPVYYPETFEQAKEISQLLKNKKALIISLDACSNEEGERILVFEQGLVLGIGAKFITLEENHLYLLLPEGMEVEE